MGHTQQKPLAHSIFFNVEIPDKFTRYEESIPQYKMVFVLPYESLNLSVEMCS